MINKMYAEQYWQNIVRQLVFDKNRVFPDEDIKKIERFSKMLVKNATNEPNESYSLLPINLSVISKINDLSRVIFTLAPTYIEQDIIEEYEDDLTLNIKVNKTPINVQNIHSRIRVPRELFINKNPSHDNLINFIEERAAKFIARRINDMLDKPENKKMKVYIYYPVQQINVLSTLEIGIIEYEILSRWTYATSSSMTLSDLDKTNEEDYNIK